MICGCGVVVWELVMYETGLERGMETFSEVICLFWDERPIASTWLDVCLDPLIERNLLGKIGKMPSIDFGGKCKLDLSY